MSVSFVMQGINIQSIPEVSKSFILLMASINV
jgi:hypothetical protein